MHSYNYRCSGHKEAVVGQIANFTAQGTQKTPTVINRVLSSDFVVLIVISNIVHYGSHANFTQVNHTMASDCMVYQAVHTLVSTGIHNPMKAKSILTQG